jgi:hypothetical protein
MLHLLLWSLLIGYTVHVNIIASSASSSANSAAPSVVTTPNFPSLNVKKALFLPPDLPPISLDDEAEKKSAFGSKSDREKSALLSEIYKAYKSLEEQEQVSLQNADGSPRIVFGVVIDMATAIFDGDDITVMITNKDKVPSRYKFNKRTGVLAAVARVQCPHAWV